MILFTGSPSQSTRAWSKLVRRSRPRLGASDERLPVGLSRIGRARRWHPADATTHCNRYRSFEHLSDFAGSVSFLGTLGRFPEAGWRPKARPPRCRRGDLVSATTHRHVAARSAHCAKARPPLICTQSAAWHDCGALRLALRRAFLGVKVRVPNEPSTRARGQQGLPTMSCASSTCSADAAATPFRATQKDTCSLTSSAIEAATAIFTLGRSLETSSRRPLLRRSPDQRRCGAQQFH